jgi:hypothetical protein
MDPIFVKKRGGDDLFSIKESAGIVMDKLRIGHLLSKMRNRFSDTRMAPGGDSILSNTKRR